MGSLYSAIAQAYQGKNDYENAIAYFEKTTEYFPQWTYSYKQISKMYSEKGYLSRAIPAQAQVVILEPNLEGNWTELVWLCFSENKPEKATKYAKEGLKHFPDSIYLSFHGARLLYESKQFEDALKLAKLTYELNNIEPDHSALLGFIYSETGDWERAISFFKESLSKAEKSTYPDFSIGLKKYQTYLSGMVNGC